MRVPVKRTPDTQIAPQTRGYQRAASSVDFSPITGTIRQFAQDIDDSRKELEEVEISKIVLAETNRLTTDFQERLRTQPTEGFAQSTLDAYEQQHSTMLDNLYKEKRLSGPGLDRLSVRLGSMRVPFGEQALSHQYRSAVAQADTDLEELVRYGSQTVANDFTTYGSVEDEIHGSISADPRWTEEQQLDKKALASRLLRSSAMKGMALGHFDYVIGKLDPKGLMAPAEPLAVVKRGGTAGLYNNMKGFQAVPVTVAAGLGLDPEEVAAVMSFETSGTMDPKIVGTDKKTGKKYIGLIQFGDAERNQYGIAANGKPIDENSTPEEWSNAILAFMEDRGFEKGMGIENFYAAILRGRAHLVDDVKDSNGTSVRNAIPRILAEHKPKAVEWLQRGAAPMEEASASNLEEVDSDTGEPVVAPVVEEDEAEPEQNIATDRTGDRLLDSMTGDEWFQALSLAYSARAARVQQQVAVLQAQEAEKKLAHEQRFNGLLNGLTEGTMTQVDIDKAVADGWLTDYDQRKKAQGIVDAKNKQSDDLRVFDAMWTTGGAFNPYDDKTKGVVEAGVAATLKRVAENPEKYPTTPLHVVMAVWERTGIFAKQGEVLLRGGLASSDAKQVAVAASIASNMLNKNPNVFAGVEGGDDIARAAANYQHFIDDLGLSAEEAGIRLANMNRPEARRSVNENAPERTAFVKAVSGTNIEGVLNKAFGRGGWFGPDGGRFTAAPQKAEAAQTYSELALDHFDQYHDAPAAQAYAQRQMSRYYGVSNGRLMKFPPNKAYPAVGGSHEYIFEQAREEVVRHTGLDIPIENVWLEPASSGSTAQAFRSGRQVPYQLHFIRTVNGHQVYDMIPGKLFVADVAAAKANRAALEKEHQRKARERGMIGSSITLNPGAQ